MPPVPPVAEAITDDADGMFQFAAASLLELSVRGREARAKLVADLV